MGETCCKYDIDNIPFYFFIYINFLDNLSRFNNLRRLQNGFNIYFSSAYYLTYNAFLFFFLGYPMITLSIKRSTCASGNGLCTFLLYRVL